MKNITYIITIIILIYVFSYCKSENTHNNIFSVSIISEKDIKISEIQIDSVKIDLSNSSSNGFLQIINDQIIFFDTEYASAYILDSNFNLSTRKLGLGKGPNEILGINYVTASLDSNIIIFDSNGFMYSIDKNWNKKRTMRYSHFSWKNNEYECNYGCKSINFLDLKKLLIPVDIPYNKINKFGEYDGSKAYYNKTAVLGEVNLENGKIEKVFGLRPPVYMEKKNQYLAMFNFNDFTVHNKTYVISWMIDSLIYEYSYPDSLICAFGVAGNQMNIAYRPYQKYADVRANYLKDYETFGYYTCLKYVEQDGLLFRCYQKGGGKCNGLQIYNNKILIADIAVPRGFIFLGKQNNKYFGYSKIDEYNETMTLYKFNLPKF